MAAPLLSAMLSDSDALPFITPTLKYCPTVPVTVTSKYCLIVGEIAVVALPAALTDPEPAELVATRSPPDKAMAAFLSDGFQVVVVGTGNPLVKPTGTVP